MPLIHELVKAEKNMFLPQQVSLLQSPVDILLIVFHETVKSCLIAACRQAVAQEYHHGRAVGIFAQDLAAAGKAAADILACAIDCAQAPNIGKENNAGGLMICEKANPVGRMETADIVGKSHASLANTLYALAKLDRAGHIKGQNHGAAYPGARCIFYKIVLIKQWCIRA